jgi:predicted membrane chloride channel (bestrophin family)
MYPLTGPYWTVPFSVIVSYVVLSIEDIGAEIEEPFHVLPLRQYTEGEYQNLVSFRFA